MTDFRKFPHIINTYELESDSDLKRNILEFEKKYKVEWCISEKVDGANFQIHVVKGEKPICGKRNSYLGEGSNFYGLDKNMNMIAPFIATLQDYVNSVDIRSITIYGEYFGQKIMNRIDYRRPYAFTFFAGVYELENGKVEWYNSMNFRTLMRNLGFDSMLVPMLKTGLSFEEAIEYNESGKSAISSTADREGIIIEPWYWEAEDADGMIPIEVWNRNFVFKHKSAEFLEHHKIFPKNKTDEMIEFNRRKDEFYGYCTESRMYSVFSKNGLPTSVKQTGLYLSEFIEDAWEDFTRDHPDYEFADNGEIKAIQNFGSKNYMLFKSVLNKLTANENV